MKSDTERQANLPLAGLAPLASVLAVVLSSVVTACKTDVLCELNYWMLPEQACKSSQEHANFVLQHEFATYELARLATPLSLPPAVPTPLIHSSPGIEM